MLQKINKTISILVFSTFLLFFDSALAMQRGELQQGLLNTREDAGASGAVPPSFDVGEEATGLRRRRVPSAHNSKDSKETLRKLRNAMASYPGNEPPREPVVGACVVSLENPNFLKDLEKAFFADERHRCFSWCGPRPIKVLQVIAALLGGAAVTFSKTVITNAILDQLTGTRSNERALFVGIASLFLDCPIACAEAVKWVGKALTKPSFVLPPCPKGSEDSLPQAWRYRFSLPHRVLKVGGGVAAVALAAMPAAFFSTLEAPELEYLFPVLFATIAYYALPYGEALQRSLDDQTIGRNSNSNSRQSLETIVASIEELERILHREDQDANAKGTATNTLWEIISEGRQALKDGKRPNVSPFLALLTRSSPAHQLPILRRTSQQPEEVEPEPVALKRYVDPDVSPQEDKILEEWGEQVAEKEAERTTLLDKWKKLCMYQEAEKSDQQRVIQLWARWKRSQEAEEGAGEPKPAEDVSGENLRVAMLDIWGTSIELLDPQQKRITIRKAITQLHTLLGISEEAELPEQSSLHEVGAGEVTSEEDVDLDQDVDLGQALLAAGISLQRDEDLTRMRSIIREASFKLNEKLRPYVEADEKESDLSQALFEISEKPPTNAEEERIQLTQALLDLRERLPDYIAAWNQRLETYGMHEMHPVLYEQLFAYGIVAMTILSQFYIEEAAFTEMEESVFTLNRPTAHVFAYITAFIGACVSIIAESAFHLKTVKALKNPLSPEPHDNRGIRLAARGLAIVYAGFNTLIFSGAHFLALRDSPTLVSGLIFLTIRMMSVFSHLSEGVYFNIITHFRTSEHPTRAQKLTELNHLCREAKEFTKGLATETVRELLRVISSPLGLEPGR